MGILSLPQYEFRQNGVYGIIRVMHNAFTKMQKTHHLVKTLCDKFIMWSMYYAIYSNLSGNKFITKTSLSDNGVNFVHNLLIFIP